MKPALQWALVIALLAMYAAAGWAVLHPHVSPEYRAYFIERTSTDYNPDHYNSTPEQGMMFADSGLPNWVSTTHGLSYRDSGGRWTDENLPGPPGLTFTAAFSGDICILIEAYAIPWLDGREIGIRFGDQEQLIRVLGGRMGSYQAQFRNLRAAERLEFLLPPNLPPMVERLPASGDTRRVGVSFHRLRLLAGDCAPAD